MIPKIIHYCWFGAGQKSQLILNCIASWKAVLSEYTFVEWNESNFDLRSNKFVEEAYKAKKWAFVTDYVRAYALYNMGGVYLDTDVEIRRPLDEFLSHGAFSGFESKGFCFTALWGTSKNHHWPEKVLQYYHQENFSETTNTQIITYLLKNIYNINPMRDELQNYQNDIYIYPSNYFCLDIPNYATHHFEGSWMDKDHQRLWKTHIAEKNYRDRYLDKHTTFKTAFDDVRAHYNVGVKELIWYIASKIKDRFGA